MAEVRTCVYTLVLLVLLQRTVASPTFGSALLCSFFCVDDYEEDSRSSGIEDYITSWLFGGDDDDSSDSDSKPSTEKPAAGDGKPQKINLSIPPANGVNLTLENSGTWWWLNLVPWVGGGSATPAAATTAAPATAAAANATATNTTAAP